MKINNFSLKGASLDGIILTAVKVMTMALGLITTRLLSQYLSIFDYGTYSLIQLVVSSTVSITILGMMDGINYFFCSEKDEEKRDAYIATIYLLQFSVSLLAGCVIAFAGGQICSYLGTPEAKRLMTYAAVLPFLQNILSMTQVLMLSVGKAKVLAVRNLVISLLRLLIVILVIVFVGSVGIILFMTCILDAAQIIVFFFMLKKSGCIVRLWKASAQLLRPIIHYCLPMAVYTALNTINRDCDKYIIAAMTNTETLAVYTNASKKLPFDLITSSFITVLLPKITRLISNEYGTLNDKPCNTTSMTTYMLVGMIAAVLVYSIYLIIYLLDDRIRTEEDIERYLGLSVLGDIPNADDKKSHQYGYYKAYGSHEQKKNRKKRRAK